MNWFEKIKSFYLKGLWSDAQVAKAVEKGKITAEEYKLITGKEKN